MENEHFKVYDPPGANQPLMTNEKIPRLLEESKEFADGAVYKPTVSMEDVVIKQPAKYVGLTKEELQRYVDDPFWKKLRWFLLALFWLAWIAMFVAAIIIVAMSPKCPPKPNLKWWQKKVCYQIWTKSFQDTNKDGVGDINGVTQRVKQLASMKIQSIWPVPLLASTSGNGYDVVDFQQVDKTLGTMEDMEKLIAEAHKNALKFVMDIPVSTVSTEHEWFKKGSASKDNEFSDYFIWSNNPKTIADHWQKQIPERQQYYFHWKKSPSFAVLNYENPKVIESMKEVFQFWLDKGVDGFYFGKVEHLSVNEDDRTDWVKVHSYLNEITSYVRNVTKDTNKENTLLFSSVDVGDVDFRLAGVKQGELNFVISSELIQVDKTCGAACIYDHVNNVNNFHNMYPNDSWPMWEIGHPYVSRVATRMGSREKGELMLMLLLVLPGSINTYYGDEIGMMDSNATVKGLPTDPKVYRAAMQWNGEKNGGFSDVNVNESVVLLNSDYESQNLEKQNKDEKTTTAKMYRRLAGLRYSDEAFLFGGTHLGPRNDTLFTLYRDSKFNTPEYLVVLNFADSPDVATYDLTSFFNGTVEKDAQALVMTSNLSRRGKYFERTNVDIKTLELKGNEGIVLRLKPKK